MSLHIVVIIGVGSPTVIASGGGGRGDGMYMVTMMVVVEKKKVCLSVVFVSAVSGKCCSG